MCTSRKWRKGDGGSRPGMSHWSQAVTGHLLIENEGVQGLGSGLTQPRPIRGIRFRAGSPRMDVWCKV